MKKLEMRMVPIDCIITNDERNCRVKIDPVTVDEYSEEMRHGVESPPIVLGLMVFVRTPPSMPVSHGAGASLTCFQAAGLLKGSYFK